MDITALTKEELSNLCDSIGKHPSGTREELLARIRHSGRVQISKPRKATKPK